MSTDSGHNRRTTFMTVAIGIMIAVVGYPLSTGPVAYLLHRGIVSME